MKKPLIAILALLSTGVKAQDIAPKNHTKNQHVFEIYANYGIGLSTSMSGNALSNTTNEKWTIKDVPSYSGGASIYIIKRLNVGISARSSVWNTTSKLSDNITGPTVSPRVTTGKTSVLSVSAFANYNQPIGKGVIYVGGSVGYAIANGDTKHLAKGKGRDMNGHIGYAHPVVGQILWVTAEAGMSQAKITPDGQVFSIKRIYSVTNYPVSLGLKVRI